MTDRPRCAGFHNTYGLCTLPAGHADDCLHKDQPRCDALSPDARHVCVLAQHHEGLHSDKPLAEVTPNGECMVWQLNSDADPVCGDRYDAYECELEPGHLGAHLDGTFAWAYEPDSAPTSAA